MALANETAVYRYVVGVGRVARARELRQPSGGRRGVDQGAVPYLGERSPGERLVGRRRVVKNEFLLRGVGKMAIVLKIRNFSLGFEQWRLRILARQAVPGRDRLEFILENEELRGASGHLRRELDFVLGEGLEQVFVVHIN